MRAPLTILLASLSPVPLAGSKEPPKDVNQPAAPSKPSPPPVPTAVRCLTSKDKTLPSGAHGLGCRETPPASWKAAACPANIGCCANEGGCLVSGVKGDGVY